MLFMIIFSIWCLSIWLDVTSVTQMFTRQKTYCLASDLKMSYFADLFGVLLIYNNSPAFLKEVHLWLFPLTAFVKKIGLLAILVE